MIIVIPAVKAEETAKVSPLFGKAQYFYLYNAKKNRGEFIENQVKSGEEIAQLVLGKKAEVFIVYHIGPHPWELIQKQNNEILVYMPKEKSMTLDQVIEAYYNDELIEVTKENIEELYDHSH